MRSFLILLVAVFLVSCHVSLAIILEVPGYATLNGTEGTSIYTNRPFYEFRSVYYAEKPTPEFRFLPPVPKAPFPVGQVVDATANNLGCALPLGLEDCLSLNIFTPKNLPSDGTGLLPVMFWIHGGSFRSGQAIEYLPGRFMEHDIVLVVIQYRLGPLGWLSFDTDEVPGNAGLFDQIEALRWVNKNIRAFGGDPDQVTIAGESAGSASVSLLLLAPQAKGLFHRAIGESGSVLAEWAIDRDGRGKKASMRIAELAGCPLEPYDKLLNCVRNMNGEYLTSAYKFYQKEDCKNGGLGFSGSNPVIQVAGEQRIIESDPKDIFISGNYSTVPIMFGANKQEGVLVLSYTYLDFLVPNNLVEDSEFLANDLIPILVKGLHIRDDTGAIADALTDKYMVGAEMGNFTSMIPGLTDMTGVLFLKSPGYETVKLNYKHNPDSYWYAFNYEGRNSLFTYLFLGNYPPIPHGVNHADEMIYLFVYPFPSQPPLLNDEEETLSKQMTQVWTNFVIYGNPTPDEVELLPGVPKWPAYNRVDDLYMDIDRVWSRKKDYTKTFTVTVDELNTLKQQPQAQYQQGKRAGPSFRNEHSP